MLEGSKSKEEVLGSLTRQAEQLICYRGSGPGGWCRRGAAGCAWQWSRGYMPQAIIKPSYKFKRSSSCMNITPRLKSSLYEKGIIVDLKIKIPLLQKSMHASLSSSPNQKKKSKLISAHHHQLKTTYNTSQQLTLRDSIEYPPSRKKQTAPTPISSARGLLPKTKSIQISPRRKPPSRKGKDQARIVRNISILEQAVNEQDNIIKYTSNSNQLKQKLQSLRNLNERVETHVSEVDIVEMRQIQQKYAQKNKIRPYYTANNILKNACAKRIQRAWRRFRTKQIIRSHSNDIRKKDARNVQTVEELTIKSARSHGGGLKLKMKEASIEHPQTERGRNSMTRFQEESIEKWEEMLEKIKNQKNIQKLLQISLERTQELRNQIGTQVFRQLQKHQFFQDSKNTPKKEKIIKTKGYYQQEREKRKQQTERSGGSIKREQKVKYFQNQMLKIQNDLSDISSDKVNSIEGQGLRQLEQLQNIKLRKKLEVFKEHLPQIHPFPQQSQTESHTNTRKMDIYSIMKKKSEQIPLPQQQELPLIPAISRVQQKLQLATPKQKGIHELSIVEEQLSSIQTHRDWTPTVELEEEQNKFWLQRLVGILKKKDDEMVGSVLEELILQALIEVSQSQKLIQFIKNIYELGQKKGKKPEGIVTSHASIKDYLNYFINYLYQHKIDQTIERNILKPVGPSPIDVLKYFRGEDIANDPGSEYVMNIRMFNQHWNYANQFIYFDPKFQDEKKEKQRVNYLKQLTKVFFRSIFDCFNQSFEHQRIYGMRGRPYPWSQQKLKVNIPVLKKAMLQSFQRVIKLSTVFCGVLFEDKHHNLDKKTMQQIQEQNMVKLILLECEQDQALWNFYEDELVEIKLEICHFVQAKIMSQVLRDLGYALRS